MATASTSYFPATGDRAVDAITNGSKWNFGADQTIYWSVSNGFFGEFWKAPGTVAQYVDAALSIFSYYANVKFVFKGFYADPALAYQAGSDINVSLNGNLLPSNVWAIGFFPNTAYNLYPGAPGDIFLNINSAANFLPSYDPGSAGWALLLHELGHALGLKHTHDDGGTGRPTLTSLGLGPDIDWISIMSYNDDFNLNFLQFDPATPQILDVIGLQFLYGINWSTNVGNTSYTLSTTGFYYTIWDAGGIDQVNASGSTTGWTIHLPNVQLSSLVPQKFGYAVPTSDLLLSSPHTLAWLEGNLENAIGSSYRDEIYGNDLANVLTGGLGNDYLNGGAGVDTAIIQGGRHASSVHLTGMYGPAVRRKRFPRSGGCGLASMYPVSDWSTLWLPTIMDISARAI